MIDVMKQALEALEDARNGTRIEYNDQSAYQDEITALRQAIEEAEKQKPVAWWNPTTDNASTDPYYRNSKECKPLYAAPPKRPVKSYTGGEPWYATDAPKHEDDDIQEYKRPWVGLTDEEIDYLEDAIDPAMYRVFARRIEAKLKEKNNG
jgi:hypothetical protein